MPAKLFVSVQFTTKTEPPPKDLLVLDKTRYQRNAVVQPLAAQLGSSLSQQNSAPFQESKKVAGTVISESDKVSGTVMVLLRPASVIRRMSLISKNRWSASEGEGMNPKCS